MRSRAPLALMEQLVMVLVFALAAALCLQVFVLSDRTSRRNEARDRAVLEAQNAAEELKSVRGDFDRLTDLRGGTWNGLLWGVSYDENWQLLTDGGQAAYYLLAAPADSGDPLLGQAEVTVFTAGGDVLASLPVAWQVPGAVGSAAEQDAARVGEIAALYHGQITYPDGDVRTGTVRAGVGAYPVPCGGGPAYTGFQVAWQEVGGDA